MLILWIYAWFQCYLPRYYISRHPLSRWYLGLNQLNSFKTFHNGDVWRSQCPSLSHHADSAKYLHTLIQCKLSISQNILAVSRHPDNDWWLLLWTAVRIPNSSGSAKQGALSLFKTNWYSFEESVMYSTQILCTHFTLSAKHTAQYKQTLASDLVQGRLAREWVGR